MQIGQTYDIKISVEKMFLKPGEKERFRTVKGVLIQITPYLYVFEYKDMHKNVIRTSIQRVEFDRRGRKAIEKAIHTIS